MNNVQPAPEHVRTELVEGQLLHRGFRVQNPTLRVLQAGRVDRWNSRREGGGGGAILGGGSTTGADHVERMVVRIRREGALCLPAEPGPKRGRALPAVMQTAS